MKLFTLAALINRYSKTRVTKVMEDSLTLYLMRFGIIPVAIQNGLTILWEDNNEVLTHIQLWVHYEMEECK